MLILCVRRMNEIKIITLFALYTICATLVWTGKPKERERERERESSSLLESDCSLNSEASAYHVVASISQNKSQLNYDVSFEITETWTSFSILRLD